jgi:Rhs element Vgr protein
LSDDRLIPTAAPADRPSFKLLVNGAAVSAEYQIEGIVVSRAFNRVASAEILIHDGDAAAESFEISEGPDFVPGAEIEIQAGYHGQDETLFKGLLLRHGIRSVRGRPSLLRLECRDAGVKLTIGRKSKYFADQTDSAIIEELAGALGLQKDIESSDVTHVQMVQFQATDWDFIVTRAEANGKLVTTRDGKLVVKAPDASASPVAALRFGGNLLELEAMMDARTQFSAVKGGSWNAADQALLDVEAAAGNAVAPGNLSFDDLAGVIGLPALSLAHGGQLPEPEVQSWVDGERVRSGFAKVRGRARAQGIAGVYPGDVVELAGVGARFDGKALVSGVRHELTSKNWEMDLTFGLSGESFGRVEAGIAEPAASGLLPAVCGLHIGVVTALEGDPDGEERIRVRAPLIDASADGTWARLATLDAGSNRGSVFRPEVDDEVVLGFLGDDPRYPVVLGQLHSSAKASPLAASDDNHKKGFLTRGGIKLEFDDEKNIVTLSTTNGNTLLLSDDAGGATLEDENGNKITLSSDGILLQSAKDISLKADGDISLDGKAVNVKASGDVKVEGSNVQASAQAQFKAEGSAGAEVSSSASTTIKGSVVQIN